MSKFVCFVLLFGAALLPQLCHGLHFRWWHQRPRHHRHGITETINKCCPKHGDSEEPLFCCMEQLFDTHHDFPQKMCREDLDQATLFTTVFTTIHCAQRKFHREIGAANPQPTDICRAPCCEFLTNIEGEKQTNCSRTCTKAAFAVGRTVGQQLDELRDIGCDVAAPTKFAALEECLQVQFVDNDIISSSGSDDDEKMDALQKVCSNRRRGGGGE